MKLKRPIKPVANTRANWKRPEDYYMALQAWHNALSIYEMFEPVKEGEEYVEIDIPVTLVPHKKESK